MRSKAPRGPLAALMGVAAGRPRVVATAVVLLAVAGGALALGLRPSAATDTLVGRDTPSWRATERLHERFGDDAVYVLVRQPVEQTVLTSDLGHLLGLEGCIAGNVPRGAQPAGGADSPCGQLARLRPARVVFGPATFLNEAAGQLADQLSAQTQAAEARSKRARTAAEKLALAQGRTSAQARKLGSQAADLVTLELTRTLYELALKYDLGLSVPALTNTQFVSRVVFDTSRGTGVPKARFAYLFPNRNASLVQVRLRPELSERARSRAIELIRAAAAMPQWKLTSGRGDYVVTGAPVVVDGLTSAISRSLVLLLAVALAVMALVLALVFRARLRLLPLAVALAATGLTFGMLAVVGAPLTMASIGVLPVLIGLAVDYAIQLQARVQEQQRAGGGVRAAVARTARRGAPPVVIAATASAAGFLALLLSPVPMVRGFGLLLVAGIALALACALTLGVAVLTIAGDGRPRRRGALGAAWRGAGELLVGNRVARALRAALTGAAELVGAPRASGALRSRAARGARATLTAAAARPWRVLALALVLAVAGWALDGRTHVESDVTRLAPRNAAVTDLQALQRSTGAGGEVDVVVSSSKVTTPEVVRWMASYQSGVLKHFGYSERGGCARAQLCPAFSLTDLFSDQAKPTQATIDALLKTVPPYFSQGVVSADRRTATVAFGIRLMSLERQQEVIDELRRRLDPPPGVRAELAGLPVLAAAANAAVASPWRRVATLAAGLAAVALVLLVALRDRRRALTPLVPIVLATGWSALVLYALRIPLNPMSVTLGALVIAISTEFSVLLSERYRSEREAGREPREALAATYGSTGAAVLASGTTAIAGFAVLTASDIRMLRDFGLVTVVDLTLALAGVMVVLPAVLTLAERGRLRVPRPVRARRRRARSAA